mgnify:CR=1 FL=1
MPHFILQSDLDGFFQEFPNAVRNSCFYQNWYHQNSAYTWESCQDPFALEPETLAKAIPAGSLEFCEQFLKQIDPNLSIPVLNIPKELEPFANRRIWRRCKKDDLQKLLKVHGTLFIKEEHKNKGFSNIVNAKSFIPEETEFFASEVVDISAEWRVFFNRGQIVDAKPYILDEWLVPDKKIIEEMLAQWGAQPPSGTIDIALDQAGRQFLLECHPFISVGLYGFDEADVALMAMRTWNWIRKN